MPEVSSAIEANVNSIHIVSLVIVALLVRSGWVRGWGASALTVPLTALIAVVLVGNDDKLPIATQTMFLLSVAGFVLLVLVLMTFIPPLRSDRNGALVSTAAPATAPDGRYTKEDATPQPTHDHASGTDAGRTHAGGTDASDDE